MDANRITTIVLGAALEVHKALGPGLLESAYEECLTRELEIRELSVKRQVPIPVVYKDIRLECGYRLDLLVEDQIIVEVKSVEALAPVHEAQMLTYLRFGRKHLGLLINFNVKLLKDGMRRFIL
ncbi:MAG: GxxExxY protein [Ignavibacteria bacterium GWA2_55_11]|nr:MAG: GxxExxY protein [Ignavibacteria bacterium GWA2_55_11]OGU44905.1 MAG: GxxExxY protein [Ignavibacteria bacterium GWC2_56_12]OGU65534.1 MAG: GxxExxY protein [Ignavibacteria bacterium RIFCSPHIGHO2_02_FULL_56_12]OGU74806.1 MAG: GxxExxY protein [Ignavibacteria bacterium RIFCSPLOWO2_02_FULL_55_14]OGU75073.1 MAG: GxxExxY protein [Ignavibacteria bacterium RIFCSPLOWO2_12_FULL_56_21]HAV22514.1 GxxExxY protein [Bacteroidota bacterium]